MTDFQTITVTRHVDETGDRLTVDHPWPFDVQITGELLQNADPRVLNRDGDRVIFTVYNGTAVYDIRRRDPVFDRYDLSLIEGNYTPASELIEAEGSKE